MVNIKNIFSNYKKIAIIGVSNDLSKPSSIVMKCMQNYGFKVFPVNPLSKSKEILGEKVFNEITDINEQVEIVDIFRPSNEVFDIAKDAVKIGAKVLWLQLGIKNEDAKKLAEKNDIQYIEDKCTKIEYEKIYKKV